MSEKFCRKPKNAFIFRMTQVRRGRQLFAPKSAAPVPHISGKKASFWSLIADPTTGPARQLHEQKIPWSIWPHREKETVEGTVFSLLDDEAALEIPPELRLPKEPL